MRRRTNKLNESETQRRKAEEALRESEEHYRIFSSYQRAISELRKFYISDATFEQMIQKILDLMIEEFGYYMAWYAELIEEEKVILPKLWAGRYEKYLDGLRLEYEDDKKDAKCAMSLAILTKKPFGYADLEHDKDFEKWRSFALQYGYRSNQAIPLIRDGKCKSAFLVYSTKPFAFSENLIEYLKGIVDELATIIENITERKKAQEALQKAHNELEMRVEERTAELNTILTNMHQGIAYLDENNNIKYVNQQCLNLFGLKHEDVFGKNIYEFHSPEKKEKIEALINEFRNGKKSLHLVEVVKGKFVDNTFYRIQDTDCNYRGILLSTFDITGRKEAEEALKKKTEQQKTLYELSKKIASFVSKEKLLPWLAKQATKLLNADECFYRLREGDYLVRGASTDKAIEKMLKKRLKIDESLSGTIAKERRPLVIEDLQKDKRLIEKHREVSKRFGFKSFLGVPMMVKDRLIGVIIVKTKHLRKFTESDIELLSAFADMAAIVIEKARLFEDLEKAKKELEKSERNLKKFSGKILSIREREKKKIATNLHDALGSMAIDLNASLSIAEEEINNKNIRDARKYLRQTKDKLKNMIRNLKNIAVDIRPIDLDIIGLPSALREYFSTLAKQAKLRIDFNVDIDEEKLNDEVSIALYRVAQEALNNVIKHAEAKKVRVNLHSQENSIKFDISDNGNGFELDRDLLQIGKFLKMGITGMRERIESLGGTFNIKSAPKKGTEINIILPFK